jgi:hypothetical protein
MDNYCSFGSLLVLGLQDSGVTYHSYGKCELVVSAMIRERWKPVLGYEKSYMVSNTGRVKSIDRHIITKDGKRRFFKGKILKNLFDKYGYNVVNLRQNKKPFIKVSKVHRLVAIAFIDCENPSQYEVNHIDGIKTNNNLSNLEFCTTRENLLHAIENNLHARGENVSISKLKEWQVKIIKYHKYERGDVVKMAQRYNITRVTVRHIREGRTWKHI